MKERVINKVINHRFDECKLSALHGLIERNENSASELAKQNIEAKNLKNDISELKDSLGKIEDNFQGKLLTKSFFMMKEDVKSQISKARVNYNIFVWLSTSIPILAFLFHFLILKNRSHVNSFDFNYFLSFTVPFIALEILLFYYVRISYLEIKILNTQKLQVEHRLAVCRFIRSYARQKTHFYEKYITDGNKEAIKNYDGVSKFIGYPDAFESLIFSPIQTSGDNIPGALDGVNSIAELVGKIMSAKK
ncbi:hypothetical protein [Pectobacterium brasiliense]